MFGLRIMLEGGLMGWLMYRWRLPLSWIAVFLIVASFTDYLMIVSFTKLGVVVLLLGYWYSRINEASDIQ